MSSGVDLDVGASAEIGSVGIVATRYRVVDWETAGSVVIGPVTTGITNTGVLRYKATLTIPLTLPGGKYEIQWDDGTGEWATVEDLYVNDPAHTDFTVASGVFTGGASVQLYEDVGVDRPGEPAGDVVETQTADARGGVTFTRLERGMRFIAAEPGTWKKIRFLVT